MKSQSEGIVQAIESIIGEIGDAEKRRLVSLAIDNGLYQAEKDARNDCATIMRRELLPLADRLRESA